MRLFSLLLTLLLLSSAQLANAEAATITVAWDAPLATDPEVTSYTLYRSDTACALTPVAPIAAKVGTVVVPLGGVVVTMAHTVTKNGTYCFELTAVNSGGESDRSNRAEAIVKSRPVKPGTVRIVVVVTP